MVNHTCKETGKRRNGLKDSLHEFKNWNSITTKDDISLHGIRILVLKRQFWDDIFNGCSSLIVWFPSYRYCKQSDMISKYVQIKCSPVFCECDKALCYQCIAQSYILHILIAFSCTVGHFKVQKALHLKRVAIRLCLVLSW